MIESKSRTDILSGEPEKKLADLEQIRNIDMKLIAPSKPRIESEELKYPAIGGAWKRCAASLSVKDASTGSSSSSQAS